MTMRVSLTLLTYSYIIAVTNTAESSTLPPIAHVADLRVLNQEAVPRTEDDIQLVTSHVNKGGDNGLTNCFISVIQGFNERIS